MPWRCTSLRAVPCKYCLLSSPWKACAAADSAQPIIAIQAAYMLQDWDAIFKRTQAGLTACSVAVEDVAEAVATAAISAAGWYTLQARMLHAWSRTCSDAQGSAARFRGFSVSSHTVLH